MQTTPSPHNVPRTVVLGVLAITLAVAAELLPRTLKFNQHWAGTAFLSATAYGTMAALMIAGMIMGLLEPSLRRAAAWTLLVGLAPLAETVIRMAQQGPGNLWPIAIVLALMMGAPALAGGLVGWSIRKLADRLRPARWHLALLFLVAATFGFGLLQHLRVKSLPQARKSALWGVQALAPGPRAGVSAIHWCRFTSAIPNLPEIRDPITVLSSANFDRDRARDLKGDPWKLTLVRLAGSDSVELRANDGTHLVLAGRMTSPDEASGVWQCSDSLSGQPDSLLVIEGEWVLRRGSWPGSELNWPVIPHPRSTPGPSKSPSGRRRLHPYAVGSTSAAGA